MLQIVHGPAQSVGPCPDRSPVSGFGCGPAGLEEQWANSMGITLLEVRLNVLVADGREGIAARQNLFDFEFLVARTGVFRCLLALMSFPGPDRGQLDSRVADHRLIAHEIERQDYGYRLARTRGDIDQEALLRAVLGRGEIDGDLFANCPSTERVLVFFGDFEPGLRRRFWIVSVKICCEQFDDFGAAASPVACGVDGLAI